jgi:hypothetical protein
MMSTMVRGRTIVVSAVDSMKIAASEMVTLVTPVRNAAAPMSAYNPTFVGVHAVPMRACPNALPNDAPIAIVGTKMPLGYDPPYVQHDIK